MEEVTVRLWVLSYLQQLQRVLRPKAAYIHIFGGTTFYSRFKSENLNFVLLMAVKSITVAICYLLPRKLFTAVQIC